jgi:apolipoprotein N-acyltransferase
MSLSRIVRLIMALGSGAALGLAFPSFNLPLFAWVAPAVLILAVSNETPLFAFLLGWLQGAAFYLLSVPWVYTVMRQYGPLSVMEAAGVLAAMIVVVAFFHGAFAMWVAWLGTIGDRRTATSRACFAAPFIWVMLEFLLMHLPDIGFPWNLLGYAAASNLAFAQVTTVTGIFGLSLLVAGYNAFLAWIVLQYEQAGKIRGIAVFLGATVLLVSIGLAAPEFVPDARPDHTAHLVQMNFPQSLSYPADWMETHAAELDELEQISASATHKLPGLVVWPEVPAPFSLQDGRFALRVNRISREVGDGFLLGLVDWKPRPNGGVGATNSAMLFDGQGKLTFIYDKIHLVPFGEYVPWRNMLTFAGKLTADIGDFERGSEYKAGQMPGGKFSVLICYEAVFPNEVRRFTANGASLLINLSNDGWFGDSAAPAQHLAMARIRAVENRRWLLRDTNNGITVAVDPYGRIVARLPANIRGQLDAPYGFRNDLTIYARWGDWIAWLCVIVALMLLLIGTRDAVALRVSTINKTIERKQ